MALGAYPIDVHHTGDANITFEELGPDHVYALPYRIAVPQGLDNALVAGRGLSATHEAHGAIRVMPTAMAVAQAVGTAAALLAAVQPAGAAARSGDPARKAQGRRARSSDGSAGLWPAHDAGRSRAPM